MKTRFLIPFILFLIGCSTGVSPLTEKQKNIVKSEGEVAVKELFNAFSENDSAKVMALIPANPDLSLVGTSGILNYPDFRKLAIQFFPKIEKQTFVTRTEKYAVIDPACFIYTWYGKNGVSFKNGESVVYDDYLISMVFRKISGEWKMVYDHESFKYPQPADPVKEFTRIENEWNTAMLNKDGKALDLLYAKEYIYTEPTGKTSNKQQDIELLTGGRYKILAQPGLSDISVTMYETVALVRGMNSVKATLDGKDASGTNMFTDVFVWRDGRWQCVSTQSVKVQKK
jgi:ketosteroid isomerase-like protein